MFYAKMKAYTIIFNIKYQLDFEVFLRKSQTQFIPAN